MSLNAAPSNETILRELRAQNENVRRQLANASDGTRQLIGEMLARNNAILAFGVERYQKLIDEVQPTRTEQVIIDLLLGNPGEAVAHDAFARHLWPDANDEQNGTLAVHVNRLREKIALAPSGREFGNIVTVRKRGYMWSLSA